MESLAERELLEALTADISKTLVQGLELPEMLLTCCEDVARNLDAVLVRIWTTRNGPESLTIQASAGIAELLEGAPPAKVKVDFIARERQPMLTNEVLGDPEIAEQEWVRRHGVVAFAGYPLLVDHQLLGIISFFSKKPLTKSALRALEAIADGIALGIERLLAEARLREQTEVVETIHRVGQVLSAELDQQKLVQAVTDAATELTGAAFGSFFYNVLHDEGGSYMLYSLSGVPRKAFEHFPMPRATELFGPTFRGEASIRIADVRKDSRYGRSSPYHGMPAGHLPVTSYLAVPVVTRSGEVLGGLFFGHPDEDVFSERHVRIVEGLASQAAIAMDNACLYQAAQRAIEERDELLARERAARSEAEIASRAKDEFLSTLSHELRTPLNAIFGWTRILGTGGIDEETHARAVETIERNAKLQARLIDDMLDVSRIISGKLRLDAQPLDLTSVINAAVDTSRPAADAKEIRIHLVLDFGAGTVLGDPVRLQQVIWNLLSNAIKFTPKGGKVQVQLERINSHVEIAVSDTGPGIADDFLPHVFERFRQADSSMTRKVGGLGLGLAIVRHLVELHGGTVEAGNRDDRTGAVFVVKLPVMVVRSPASSHAADELRVHPTVSGQVPFDCPTGVQGTRILAVDDEADARHLLATVLQRCGAEVTTCASAAEALAALEEGEYDVLISDIGMPGGTGYDLIREVRAREEGPAGRLPAVALTAYARVEDRMQALTAGYDMHVPKPVEPAELAVVVASLAGRNASGKC